MIYLIAGLVILSLIFFLMFLFEKNDKKKIKERYVQMELVNEGLRKELEKVTAISKIKEEKQNEANEKIEQLFDGDIVSNAIDGLSKHKNKI